MEFTTRQLRALLAVADTRSFTRAAELVHVTQPALSAQIRTLEEAIGGRLVQRSQRGAILTPLGRAVERHARAIEVEQSRLRSLARRGGTTGVEVAIGLIPTVAPYLLPHALARLSQAEHPVGLRVHELTSAELLMQLRAGALDLAVLALPYDIGNGLVSDDLFDDPFLIAGSATEVGRADPRPQKLDIARLLLMDEGHCLADQALSLCRRARNEARTDVSAATLPTLCRLAEAGYGLTLLPALAAKVELTGTLRARGMQGTSIGRRICLVYDPGLAAEPWLPALREALATSGRHTVEQGLAEVTRT